MNPTRQAVWDKTGGRCFFCGLVLEGDEVETITGCRGGDTYKSWMEVDHVRPRSKGGIDTLDNMVPTCTACNCSKGNKSLEEYRHYVALRRDGRPKLTDELVELLTFHQFRFPPLPTVTFWFEEQGYSISQDLAVARRSAA